MKTLLPLVATVLAVTLLFCAPLRAEEEPATKTDEKQAAKLSVDKDARTVTVPCKVAARKLENLSETYPIEVVATWPAPKGKKAHETVVTFDVKPSEVHAALESLGLKPGKPAKGEGAKAAGPEVKLFLQWAGAKRIPVERALSEIKTGKPLPTLKWHFTGSVMSQLDPEKPEKIYGADATGTLISLFPVTDETVFQTNLTMKDEPLLKLDTNKTLLPAEGTALTLIIQVK